MMLYEAETVLRATRFAAEAHDGQRRKWANEPYILHPMRVARRVAVTEDADLDMIVAALLHDVIEDCPKTLPVEINMSFGDHVRYYVDCLTDPQTIKGGPNRKLRKEMTLVRLQKAPAAVQTIKCADLLDNTPSIILHDPSFSVVYLREAWTLFQAMKEAEETLREELKGMLEWAQKQQAFVKSS